MTAVEQFIEQLEQQGNSWENASIGRMNISILIEDYLKLIEQAKEMEKEHHKQTWFESTTQFDNSAEMTYKKEFKQYYYETFKSE
jgi:hypothetical protein